MSPFLKQVAEYLFEKYKSNINQITLVFPSRRSGVFFNAYLNELVQQPTLGPEVLTISEFIAQLSGMQISDQIGLIMRLHEVYIRETGHLEELDEFYFWGEILLNDFNDIDKYLLDANDIFQNIADLKEIESRFDYLSAEQKKAIEAFWGNLGKAADSENRKKFMEIWNKLPAIYKILKDELLTDGAGYSGLIYRDVAENFSELERKFDADHYVFVGFNALNASEKKLFKSLDALGKASFFWDYDPVFVDDIRHEAGLFIRENLILFPPPEDFEIQVRGDAERKIKLISVPGQVAQAQTINQKQLFEKTKTDPHFDDAALVLADENLLMPIVSAAGNQFDTINITMGYPFQNTPVYSLISQLIDLQKNSRIMGGKLFFYYRPVLALLNHQLLVSEETRGFIAEIHKKNKIYIGADEAPETEILKNVFAQHKTWQQFLDKLLDLIRLLGVRFQKKEEDSVALEAEYLYQAFLSLQRLNDMFDRVKRKALSLSLFYRILLQHLQRISIPFEGEPLSGLQVMGVLETRNLDFKKLIVFSVNEGKLPTTSTIHSFIPYHLRKAFSLPAYEEQDAMYAYYFYRLIHRAEEVVLVYDSSSDGLNSGEVSRYILQLEYDSEFKAEKYAMNFDFKAVKPTPISIDATVEHQRKLLKRYAERRLSPSALNIYLDCKLKFYFQNIAGIRQKDELLEDVDPRLFGNLFHLAAEEVYGRFKNKIIQKEDLEVLLIKKQIVEKAILLAFREEYYKDKELSEVVLAGNNILIAEHLKTYLEQMIRNDLKLVPFNLIDLEGNFEDFFELKLNGESHRIKIGGIVDRIDETNDGVRIIDYKTGRSLKLDFKSMDELFNRDYKERRKEIMQTLVYSEIFERQNPEKKIIPAIYKIDRFFDDDFSPEVKYRKQSVAYRDVAEEFRDKLEELLSEIFSDSNCYTQTKDERKCTHCPFNKICRKD